jgi:hypothetical protein
MDMNAVTPYVEIAKAVGAVGTPIVVAILAYIFQKRQKVVDAAMAERQKAADAAMAERQKAADAATAERQQVAEAARAARQKVAEAARTARQKVAEAALAERIKRIGTISPLLNKIFAYRQRLGNFLDCSPEDILSAKREADREFWTFEYLWSQAFKDAYDQFMRESFEMFRAEGKRAGIHAESKYYPKKAATAGWDAFTERAVDKKLNKEIYNALQSAIARDLGFHR